MVLKVDPSKSSGNIFTLNIFIVKQIQTMVTSLGTFYMQGYKVKEKTAIVPPVSKLSGHPDFNSRCVYFIDFLCSYK
jgi:hypothetical protein